MELYLKDTKDIKNIIMESNSVQLNQSRLLNKKGDTQVTQFEGYLKLGIASTTSAKRRLEKTFREDMNANFSALIEAIFSNKLQPDRVESDQIQVMDLSQATGKMISSVVGNNDAPQKQSFGKVSMIRADDNNIPLRLCENDSANNITPNVSQVLHQGVVDLSSVSNSASTDTKSFDDRNDSDSNNDKIGSLWYACESETLPGNKGRDLDKKNVETNLAERCNEDKHTEFICSTCGKQLASKQNLDAHTRVHSGETPYRCSECNKSFQVKHNLKRHMSIHSAEKPYRCPECHNSFRLKQGLKRHMMIHSGEKPYKCLECDKSFRQKVGLKEHMTIHSGEKPYSCSECNETFRRPQYVTKHMKIHREKVVVPDVTSHSVNVPI